MKIITESSLLVVWPLFYGCGCIVSCIKLLFTTAGHQCPHHPPLCPGSRRGHASSASEVTVTTSSSSSARVPSGLLVSM